MTQELSSLSELATAPQSSPWPWLRLSNDNYNLSADDENNKEKSSKILKTSQEKFDDHYFVNSLLKLAPSGYGPAATTATVFTSKTQAKEAQLISCPICGKTISTYQALGGHKSSHRSKKNPSNFTTATTERSRISVLEPSGKSHQCEKCYKFFPSGQALGGDKRIHLEVPPPTSRGHRGGHENSDPSRSRTAKVIASAASSSDSGPSSHESEEIDLELRLGRSIDVKMKSQRLTTMNSKA